MLIGHQAYIGTRLKDTDPKDEYDGEADETNHGRSKFPQKGTPDFGGEPGASCLEVSRSPAEPYSGAAMAVTATPSVTVSAGCTITTDPVFSPCVTSA